MIKLKGHLSEKTLEALKERGVIAKVIGLLPKQKKKVKKLDERVSLLQSEK